MDIAKAYIIGNLTKDLEKLENKIKWVTAFIDHSTSYGRGELRFTTEDSSLYNILLEEQYEALEVANRILEYYVNKRECILKEIETM